MEPTKSQNSTVNWRRSASGAEGVGGRLSAVNTELPGVKGLINRLMSRGDFLSPETFVDGCLDLIGPITVDDGTRSELVAHAQKAGDLRHGSSSEQSDFTRRTGEMFQMIASTAEFQFE